MASRSPCAFLQVALHVLDRDGGVIDQDADRQRQAAQRHDVDRLAQQAQHDDRGQDRQRNGDRDDDRAAPAAEEDQDHQPRSGTAAITASRITPAIAALTKIDWSASGCDPQLRRQASGRRAAACARMPSTTSDGGGVAGLQDADQHAAPAVLPHDVGLRRETVADGGDVAQVDRGVADQLDRQVVQAARTVAGAR